MYKKLPYKKILCKYTLDRVLFLDKAKDDLVSENFQTTLLWLRVLIYLTCLSNSPFPNNPKTKQSHPKLGFNFRPLKEANTLYG